MYDYTALFAMIEGLQPAFTYLFCEGRARALRRAGELAHLCFPKLTQPCSWTLKSC